MQDDSGSGGAVSEVSASAVPLIDFSFEEEEEVISPRRDKSGIIEKQ